jgi:Signal transduction histidine kinase
MTASLKTHFLLILVSITIHAAILYDYWFRDVYKLYPSSWDLQYTVTIIVLFILSLILAVIRSKYLKWILFSLNVFGVFVITVPFADSPHNFGLIYSFLIFEGFLYFNSYFAISLGIVCMLFSFLVALIRLPLWTWTPKAIDMGVFVFLWTQCFFTSIISYYLVREFRLRYKEQKYLENLKVSNKYLAEINIQLQDIAAQAELTTVIKERTRIAREIHDVVAYTITNLLALLNTHREKLKAAGEIFPTELEQARTLARDGLGEVREVLRTLREGDHEKYNGLASIKRLIAVFRQATGIEVDLNFGEVSQFLGESYEKVIYRVVQEALTNAFRHGQATQIFVSFCYYKGNIEVTVHDNGIGTINPSGGFGLIGIKERVAELGGSVFVSSQPECGFILQIKLPFHKETMQHGNIADYDSR